MSGNLPARARGRGRGDTSLPSHPRGRGRGRGEGSTAGRARGYGQASSRGDTHGSLLFGGPGQGGRGRGGDGSGGIRRGRGGSAQAEITLFSHGAGGSAQPDSNVTKTENEVAANVKHARTKTSTFEARLPHRPGFGTQGREVLLWANYFELVSYGDLLLHRYSIEILPDHAGRRPVGKKIRRIVQLLLEEHLVQYGADIATDFKSNLVSPTQLDIVDGGYNVVYRAENEDDPQANARHYRVRLSHTASLTVSELLDHLTSTQAGALLGSKEGIIQALNIVVGHNPKAASHIASIGSNRHYGLAEAASERMSVGAGLAAIRGFFISVRAATGRLLVNIQVKHGSFYEDGPLERVMAAYLESNGPNKVKLARFVTKISISVTHIVRKNKAGRQIPRIKVITGLATRNDGAGMQHPPIVPDFGAASKDVQFWLGDSGQGSSPVQVGGGAGSKKGKKALKSGPKAPSQGRYISVYDFFRQEHSIIVHDPSLPVVNVGTRESPSYLPAQVCLVISGQPSNSPLSPAQTQQMIRFAVRKPAQNAQSIITSGAQMLAVDHPNNPTLNSFNISIRPRLITVPGRVLNSPNVKYDAEKWAPTRFGSWNMQQFQFTTKAELASWICLWISSSSTRDPWRDEGELQASVITFTSKLRELGVNCTGCSRGLNISVTPADVESKIDEAFHRFTSNPNRPAPKLVLVIIPSVDTVIYNRVKYVCDVKEGLINVCVIASKFANANDQYLTNVALKFNLKLGGCNQTLESSKLGILSEGKTMIAGIDVTHPSPGSSSNAPSVVGIVASVDKWLGQWPADLAIQTARQEMVSGLKALMKVRLTLWKRCNGAYPENILIYRDGVSEGQYSLVLDQELPEIRSACAELYPADKTKHGIPHVTIIIVGKRHNTRFYPTKIEQADRSSNPQNGTVVDRGVTEARNWDFFLQAHTAIQGTARPAHYYIVYDEIFQVRKVQQTPFRNAADALEDLTHNLCYLFGRATKAVSICPPAYYADLVCGRARCYLSGLFEPSSASPAGSLVGGAGGDGGGDGNAGEGEAMPKGPDSSLVKIHDNVRDTMFYI